MITPALFIAELSAQKIDKRINGSDTIEMPILLSDQSRLILLPKRGSSATPTSHHFGKIRSQLHIGREDMLS